MGSCNKHVWQKRKLILLRRKVKANVEEEECVQSIGVGLSRSLNSILADVLNRT